MTIHLVTFSDESMSRSRELCVDSATDHGVDGITWAYAASESDMAAGRGLGFWAWKPRIVLDFLTDTTGGLAHPEDGDILIYSDVGVEFINNISHIIDRMDQDIFLFGNNWEHAHWCKRDIVEAVWPLDLDQAKSDPDTDDESLIFGEWWADKGWSRFGKQAQASVIFFRVSGYSKQFVAEWLKWCLFEGGRLIDDSPSRAPNHPEFRENRHDQAVLTTIAYREGLRLHYWPSVYNRGGSSEFVYEKLPEYMGDDYPILFNHHRKRDHEWENAA